MKSWIPEQRKHISIFCVMFSYVRKDIYIYNNVCQPIAISVKGNDWCRQSNEYSDWFII